MLPSPKTNRAMLGYALWIVIEDSLRNWLAKRLIDLFGAKWDEQIPLGIWVKLMERYNQQVKASNFSQVRDLLEYSDFPDVFDIVRFRKRAKEFVKAKEIEGIEYYTDKLYALRNQIAHKPNSFSLRNLDDLISCSEWVIEVAGTESVYLAVVRNGIEREPELFAREIPNDFIELVAKTTEYKIPNNLPVMDYEYDGGFVGRRDERQDIKRRLLDKRIHPIITISGAGGVGKTAIAHCICEDILKNHPKLFDALIWISAKKDRLTLTGIEEIEPTAQSFEEVLNAILVTFGFNEYLYRAVDEKRKLVQEFILDYPNSSILLVIDNLETLLQDKTLLEYLKDIPLPHKVLITSRLGLGETERRIPLKQMSDNDAMELFRKIALEKSVKGLAQLPNETIKSYIRRMNGYPLVIKWVVGQASLNRDIERLVQSINTTDSDIAKFCFEYIFDVLLSENAKLILRCLAASEQELTQPVIMHVTELRGQPFEDAMQELELASLVIPEHNKDPNDENRVVTKSGILPLTRAYIISREGANREFKERLQSVQALAENARRAKRQYELSLEYLGAETDDELIASKYVQTAFIRNQANDYSGAFEAIERARELAPNFAAVLRSWAVIEANNKNNDKAIDLYEKATQMKSSDPTTWFLWGKLEKDLGNYDNARRHLHKALGLVENKAPVLNALGNVEKQDSNFTEALRIFEEALSTIHETEITDKQLIVTRTSMADSYYLWAENYERDKQLAFAIEKAQLGYNIMRDVRNEFGSNDQKTRETLMQCMLILGRLHNKNNDPTTARQFLEELVSIEMNTRSSSVKQRRFVAQACYNLIPMLLDSGNIDEARRVYQHGLNCIAQNDRFLPKYELLGPVIEGAKRYQGQFIRIFTEKGYGFIKSEEIISKDIFAHVSDVLDEFGDDFSAMENVWVSFSLETNDKGINAKAIRILH